MAQKIIMLTTKKSKYVFLVVLLEILGILIFQGFFITSFAVLTGAYLIYELLGADRMQYDVQQDYDYQCLNSQREELAISQGVVCIPETYRNSTTTTLLELDCEATITGQLFDPFVDILCDGQSIRQYFERGFSGKRYLNISHLPFSSSANIALQLKHCRYKSNSCQIISMPNPDISTKKILVIAPHADDAEIAAFGLYSSHNSMVVTITAGESEPDPQHLALTESPEAAAILKGQLRAWDSLTVPLWAGLSAEQAINLGYPDSSLEKLHSNPEASFPSGFQTDFRQFNTIKLSTDNQPSISWQSLVKDLSDIIHQFKPDVIVTPHLQIDSHKDHQLSTQAIKQAVSEIDQAEPIWLYYINHLSSTDRWPFGPHGTAMSAPPGKAKIEGFYSHPVNHSAQIRKACSLDMMHDLRKPMKIRHHLRYWLQQKLLQRDVHPLGKNPYFRRSVRSNELFIIETDDSHQ